MAQEVKGLNVELTVEADGFRDGIASAKKELKGLDASLRTTTKMTKFDDTKLEGFAKSLDILDRKITSQSRLIGVYEDKIKALNDAMGNQQNKIASLASTYGDNSTEVSRAKAALANYQKQSEDLTKKKEDEENALKVTIAQYNKTKSSLDAVSNSTEDASKKTKDLGDAADTVKDKMSAFKVALGNLVADGVRGAIDGLKTFTGFVAESGVAMEDAMANVAAVLQKNSNSAEIQDLSNYFRELAKNSKYSADEIAANAEVLANAGYNANQIKSSIKSINDLAIGTGESFETMANVTVDGLAAFGMQASEASHFVDVLAKSAISSNTDVTMMGEAFAYAGSVAGTFGYSVEDVAVALGTMATQGVKSTSAGTALRSMITRLAANTSHARDTLEALGIEFYNTDGTARPLHEVLNGLRKAMSGLTDEEKSAAMYAIAGQRGLTGLAAIVNTSEDAWQDLTSAVANCNHTVDNMANTKLDTFSGQVKKLQNNFKDVAVDMFQRVEPSINKVMRSLTKLMNSEAFRKDVSKIADNAASGVEHLAKVIDKMDGDILTSAGHVVKYFASFTGATLASGKVADLAGGLGDMISSIATARKEGKGFADILSSIGKGSGILSVGIGATVVSLQAVIAHAKQYQQSIVEAAREQWGMSEAMQETVNRANELASSYDSTRESCTINGEAVLAEYGNYQKLATEYDKLIDSNGQIKAGYEGRAQVIMGELQNATGIEATQIQTLIDKYGSMSSAIQDVILQKEAEAVANAYLPAYQEALTNINTAQQTYADLLAQQPALIQTQKDAENELALAQAAVSREGENGNRVGFTTLQRLREAGAAYSAATEALKQNESALVSSGATVDKYQTDIANHNKLLTDSVSGTSASIRRDIDDITHSFQYAGTASVESLRQQAANTTIEYNNLKSAYDNGDKRITEDTVKASRDRMDRSIQELRKAQEMERIGKENGEGFANGVGSADTKVDKNTKKMRNTVENGLGGIDTYSKGVQAGNGLANGLSASLGNVRRQVNLYNSELSRLGSAKASVSAAQKKSGGGRTRALYSYTPTAEDETSEETPYTGFSFFNSDALATVADNALSTYRNAQNGAKTALYGTHGMYTQRKPKDNVVNNDNSVYSPTYSINVYQRDGEDGEQLARRVSQLIDDDATKRRAVWR